MADNSTGLNAQYEDPPFGLKGDYARTGAPGSAGARGDAADNTEAGPVTPPTGTWQPSARFGASANGTMMPDQTADSAISVGPESAYSDTNAGKGRAGHWPRVHPGRAVKRAVTPKVVKKASRAMHPIDNAAYSVQRSVATNIRSGRKRKATVSRHGSCPVNHRSAEAAARCKNP